jgi:cysteine desulfurase
MNVDRNCANSAIRFSLSRFTTESEIDYVLDVLPKVISRLRSISPYA